MRGTVIKGIIGGTAAAAGAYAAGRHLFRTEANTKNMYDSLDYGLTTLKSRYSVRQLDAGKFSDLKMNPLMKFHVNQYDIEGLGNLAVMTTKMKPMQMCSFVLTPCGVNVPLMSLDLIYIMGKRKFIVEFYDLVGDTETEEYRQVVSELSVLRDEFSDLADEKPKKAESGEWLKSESSLIMHKEFPAAKDERGTALVRRALDIYLGAAEKAGRASDADRDAQQAATNAYVERLLGDGGVSTEMFIKSFGREMTEDFYRKVFFACPNAG